jgi:hypothetical protein
MLLDMDGAFKAGKLLLPDAPAEALAASGPTPVVASTLVLISVLLGLLFLRNFLNVFPYLLDNFTRARGSAALEGSVRVSRDRNIVALVFIIPFILLVSRYRIYEPDFLVGRPDDIRLLVITGIFLCYLLLRYVLWFILQPHRYSDNYPMARKAAYTFFIMAGLVVLPTVGILSLFGVNDLTVRTVILAETGFIYLVYLIRKCQILSMVCGGLQVFLYLCALEVLPTGLLIASALFL